MANIGQQLGLAGGQSGSVTNPVNTGKAEAGSGNRKPPGIPAPRGAGPRSADVAAAVAPPGAGPMRPPGPAGPPGAPRPPGPGQVPAPKMIIQGGPPPRPGVQPPYPDARSPNPTLMSNGVPVMPPPRGFPLAGMIPRVPLSFAPGARAQQTAPASAPPTMPPVAQSHMPLTSHAMQTPHIPPGGMPMPQRPGQTPQAMRRPGMGAVVPPPSAQGAGPAMPMHFSPQGLMGRAGAGGIGATALAQAARTPTLERSPGTTGGPPGAVQRPVPGGPPVRAPDGNLYIHMPHPGGLYHRVPG